MSKFPRDKVPIKLFRRYPEYDDSPMSPNCSDCRKHHTTHENQYEINRRLSAAKLQQFRCNYCGIRALNLNGTQSEACNLCKITQNKRVKYTANICKTIKFEIICGYQSCCNICQNIFIRDPNDVNKIIEIKITRDKIIYM